MCRIRIAYHPSFITGPDDILKTIDMVEDVSAKADKRKKTPPSNSQKASKPQKSKAEMIRELGNKGTADDNISIYRKSSTASRSSASPEKRLSEERKSPSVERDSLPSASKQFMMDRRSMDVSTDILNTIQEERTKSPYDENNRDGRKDSAGSDSSSSQQPLTVGQRLANRGKFPFNR